MFNSLIIPYELLGLMGEEFVWIVSDAVAGNVNELSYNGAYRSYYQVGTKPGNTGP